MVHQPKYASIDEAVHALRAGAPVVFPTDTVYGVGVAVEFAASLDVLYQVKGRAADKPVSWLVACADDLLVYGRDVAPEALRLARTGWPGALTLIVRASNKVPRAFRSVAGSIGLRVADSALVCELIARVGCPLATTSANVSGARAVACAGELEPEFVRAVQAVGGVVLAGDVSASGVASMVVDCTGEVPHVLRG